MKLLFFDIETTGVMHWKNGIHQLSGSIEIDGAVKETFNFRVKPNPAAKIESEALLVSGITLDDLETFPDMQTVFKQFIDMLSRYVNRYDKKDKFFLVGYNNASFDNQFLRAWFVQNGDQYFGSWFWSSTIDVMVMAAWFLTSLRPKMENFKLMTVARELGIEVEDEKLHDAGYDIYLTREIYYLITKKVML